MDHDREQNRWLGNMMRRSRAGAGDACVDGETLAAWADGGLGAKAAAAVELHVSSCSRCTAVLAAMERSAPASAQDAWTSARLFRWLVPLTAVATAIAIWIVVPDRPVTSVIQSVDRTTSERADSSAEPVPAPAPVPVPGAVPGAVPVPERRTPNQNPVPSTQNQEPRANFQLRDEAARQRATVPEAMGAPAAAAPEAPPAFAPVPPPPAVAASKREASPTIATDTLAETTASAAQRSALAGASAVTSQATASTNPRFLWRVVGSMSIERSTDGGKTWSKTLPVPGVSPQPDALTIVGIRAVDEVRAVARTSDGKEFYTADAGLSWIPVQENSAAPF